MTPSETIPSLTKLGNVPRTYQHEWRVAEPRPPIILPEAVFKWYHVRRDGIRVPT